MVMQYCGGAPGHTSTREATDYFLDELDEQERQNREDALAEEQSDEDVDMNEGDKGEDEGEDDGESNEDSDNESFYESGEEQDFVMPDTTAEEQ